MRERTFCEFCPPMGFCVVCGQGDDGDDMNPGDDDPEPIIRQLTAGVFVALLLGYGAALLS